YVFCTGDRPGVRDVLHHEQLGAIRDRQSVAISATGKTTAETAVLLFLLHREPERPIERSIHTSLTGCGFEEPKGGIDHLNHLARVHDSSFSLTISASSWRYRASRSANVLSVTASTWLA